MRPLDVETEAFVGALRVAARQYVGGIVNHIVEVRERGVSDVVAFPNSCHRRTEHVGDVQLLAIVRFLQVRGDKLVLPDMRRPVTDAPVILEPLLKGHMRAVHDLTATVLEEQAA